jgi:hypothetical protein
MAARLTKKAVIRQHIERERPAEVGGADAAAIRKELAAALGPSARISDDYLLHVLDDLGVRVSRELRGVSPELYAQLHFSSLEAAEETLRLLDRRYQEALSAGDDQALNDCRAAGILVRRRASLIARNPKVDPAKRAQKEEIARWFIIWLQTPALFFDWLEIRKSTEEFARLREAAEDRPPRHGDTEKS